MFALKKNARPRIIRSATPLSKNFIKKAKRRYAHDPDILTLIGAYQGLLEDQNGLIQADRERMIEIIHRERGRDSDVDLWRGYCMGMDDAIDVLKEGM